MFVFLIGFLCVARKAKTRGVINVHGPRIIGRTRHQRRTHKADRGQFRVYYKTGQVLLSSKGLRKTSLLNITLRMDQV